MYLGWKHAVLNGMFKGSLCTGNNILTVWKMTLKYFMFSQQNDVTGSFLGGEKIINIIDEEERLIVFFYMIIILK